MADNKTPDLAEQIKQLKDRISKLEKQNCKHNYDREIKGDDSSRIVCKKCGDVR